MKEGDESLLADEMGGLLDAVLKVRVCVGECGGGAQRVGNV